MRYLVVIEESDTGYSAYSPDLQGCAATGVTRDETEATMREAIEFHIEGLAAEGFEIPQPSAYLTFVEVDAPQPISRRG